MIVDYMLASYQKLHVIGTSLMKLVRFPTFYGSEEHAGIVHQLIEPIFISNVVHKRPMTF